MGKQYRNMKLISPMWELNWFQNRKTGRPDIQNYSVLITRSIKRIYSSVICHCEGHTHYARRIEGTDETGYYVLFP